ncbi:hypothetical protein AGLY_015131 [Aphis glycines]|uniref:DUF4806 domain-containing protein n=1 Tax=Aphis glycines TaxID=307491 RepID=A0A6G0T187_APHGL|nr:hypothetical protein AGLY_015131 [Aphis glycines]
MDATCPDSQEYSVIPTNWVLKTVDRHGNAIVKCMWPPVTLHVTSDVLKEAMEPFDDWNTYRIKLFENGKELYGQSSSMMNEDSDTSSDEALTLLNRKKNKGPQTGMIEQTVVNNISETQFIELNNINLSPSSSSENVSLNMAIFRSFNIPGNLNFGVFRLLKHKPPFSPTTGNYIDKPNTIMELLNLIYMEQIQSRIKAVNKIGLINNASTVLPNFDDNFMSNWPMNNEQMFQHVSNCLLNDSFVSLEHFYISIGRNAVKDNVKRVLAKTFTDEFVIRRGKSISTKLCDSKIEVILKTDWFGYATTRYKRSLE